MKQIIQRSLLTLMWAGFWLFHSLTRWPHRAHWSSSPFVSSTAMVSPSSWQNDTFSHLTQYEMMVDVKLVSSVDLRVKWSQTPVFKLQSSNSSLVGRLEGGRSDCLASTSCCCLRVSVALSCETQERLHSGLTCIKRRRYQEEREREVSRRGEGEVGGIRRQPETVWSWITQEWITGFVNRLSVQAVLNTAQKTMSVLIGSVWECVETVLRVLRVYYLFPSIVVVRVGEMKGLNLAQL